MNEPLSKEELDRLAANCDKVGSSHASVKVAKLRRLIAQARRCLELEDRVRIDWEKWNVTHHEEIVKEMEAENAQLKSRIAELEHVPEMIRSMSEGKRLVWMLKDRCEKLKKLLAAMEYENGDLRAALGEVLKFNRGEGKYDFSSMPTDEREIAAFDAWQEIRNSARKALGDANG